MSEPKKTWSDLINALRSLLALIVANLATDISPKSEKDIYIHAIAGIARKITENDVNDCKPNDKYHAKRFLHTCLELGLDPEKVLTPSSDGVVVAIAAAFSRGELDEVELMRSLQNLSILNGGKWK
jgi:hypothetical protein